MNTNYRYYYVGPVRKINMLIFRFMSSSGKLTSLQDYVSRMKDKQESIFYMAGASKEEVEKSPFVERLLKKGYEVLYLTEAVDEYAISALPEFEGMIMVSFSIAEPKPVEPPLFFFIFCPGSEYR
jgi:HSP90 family molecular chaperone